MENLKKTIKDLFGRTFRVETYDMYVSSPVIKNVVHNSLNRDVLSNNAIILLKTRKKNFYALYYAQNYKLWICFKLKKLSYNKLEDIRKAYLHENIYHA